MAITEGTTIYTLDRGFPYSRSGNSVLAQFLELREPKHSHFRQYCKIKQTVTALTLAAAKIAKEQGLGEDDIVAGTEIKSIADMSPEEALELEDEASQKAEMLMFAFGASDRIDLAEFVETFGTMACKGAQSSVVAVDGVQPMTDALWSKVHPDDQIQVALRYASFFCMPSTASQEIESEGTLESRTRVMEA